MNYSFHPLAEIELNEAIDYYNERQLDLGNRFPQWSEEEIKKIYLRRIDKCRNLNY